MTHDEKVSAAKALLISKGLKRPAYAPTLVALLWRLGVKVPPPHFASRSGVFSTATGVFSVLWGGAMWWFRWSHSGMPILKAIGISLILGCVVGGCFATYYRLSAKRHGIPTWDEFEGAPWGDISG